jgi:hypothetical protein
VHRSFCVFALLAGLLLPLAGVSRADAATGSEPGDATVIAVIDSAFTPYHWDYLASKMPQATDSDPDNDLPLDQSPDTWLPGFPAQSSFESFGSLNLTLDATNANTDPATLDAQDAAVWDGVQSSTSTALKYYWMPGTKVIGAMTFGSGRIHGPTTSHGTGTTSVSVGNLHGTCPECLLVFIQYETDTDAEDAISWAMAQPWIDAISNSYGFSFPTSDPRTRLYNGSDVAAQRAASLRGQTIFFSAGNGLENAFVVPNQTLLSSQEGPDWIVTVGAISPDWELEPFLPTHASYTGHGKPADIAALGESYPSAYESPTVSGQGDLGFSGTSNATPVIAGTYSRALYLARRDLAGASRTQSGGVIASGGGFACGAARPACELGDGTLTAAELRTRLFEGAVHSPVGMTVAGLGPSLPAIGEDEYLNEGHGSYIAREKSTAAWLSEFEQLLAPLEGRGQAPARPDGERDWMTVDSWCRQHIWGSWSGGYWTGQTLPPSSTSWPVRTLIEDVCPVLQAPPAFFKPLI